MMVTTFWHSDGTPMSAQQFMEMLFGKFPEFFKDEAELRALWSVPDTRAKLLEGLAEKGFGKDQMAEMQRIIDAEKSDLFDVLAHVAYSLAPQTREERAVRAKVEISSRFNSKQQGFLDFVLAQYVKVGVYELDRGQALARCEGRPECACSGGAKTLHDTLHTCPGRSIFPAGLPSIQYRGANVRRFQELDTTSSTP